MKTLTKMFLLCCWCMFSIGFAKDHLDQIQENAQLQTIQEKLELEQALDNSTTTTEEIKEEINTVPEGAIDILNPSVDIEAKEQHAREIEASKTVAIS